jgi:ribonuclease Z
VFVEFAVTILGSNSAVPANGRHPTAQVLSIKEHLVLIDCGEGTQMQIAEYKIKASKIEYVFISHLHGDHFFGLVGLITSYNLNQRQKPLTIYCPEGLEDIIKLQLKHSDTQLRFELNFVNIKPVNGQLIFDNGDFTVTTLQMNHRIPCSGFLFREKNTERRIIKDSLAKYKVDVEQIPALKAGKDYITEDGTVIANALITEPPHRERSYAFCTDTSYLENLVPHIKEVDLLYHEATFTNDMQERANETFHSTTREAATIALKANVRKLLIGHFSARYRELDFLLDEAKAIFPNTKLAEEGLIFSVDRT